MRYWIILGLIFVAFSYGFTWNTAQKETLGTRNTKEKKIDCNSPVKSGYLVNKMKGMSLVAPPKPFSKNPMIELNALGADWVAVLPYAYFSKNQPEIRNFPNGGWWGDREEGACKSIENAHQKKIKVMLKPQLWTHDQWIGELDFSTEKEWKMFEKNYTDFILKWAAVADRMDVDLFCIGTEIRRSAAKRAPFWRKLIDEIKTIYKGKLTYASNWDDYDQVSFWDKLDYIGTDAYFPLSPNKTPTVCDLKAAWKPIFAKLKAYGEQWKKPFLFTEFGYLSLDGCTHKTWELEKKRTSVGINQQGQANAIQALFETFGKEDWWAGGFLWKWYPNYTSAMGEGKRERDYTPQGKIAADVLKKMYQDKDE